MSLIDESPNSVAILSVYQQANLLPGSIGWPILQPQQSASPSIFFNVIKVAGSSDQFHIQSYQGRYLAPGGDRNSCLLVENAFAWKIVKASESVNPVNLYNIIDPANGNLLQPGYRFADPANAYAVLSQAGDASSALASWVIEKVPA